MAERFLLAAIIFYVLGFIATCVSFTYATEKYSGSEGPGVIAAAFIISGTFFQYHYFTNKHNP